MGPRGQSVRCQHDPRSYSRDQITRSLRVAYMMDRGELLLLEPPEFCPVCFGRLGEFCTRCNRR